VFFYIFWIPALAGMTNKENLQTKESRMIVDERLREDLKEIETRMDAIRGYL